ncbi:MAG: hypothetical protein ACIAXF_15890 [Phycisphaerales bacterium JB063]
MSSDPSTLLRMLEPAVRPGGVSGIAPRRAGDAPFESKPFDQLLQEAGAQPAAATQDDAEASAKTPDPLAALAGIVRIENVSLREHIEKARAAAPHLLNVSPESPSTPE